MIEADRPPALPGQAGQGDPRQLQPPFDPAPLILTLALAPDDQARFDRLRAAHFPPERNVLSAHVTLFHHLPGAEAGRIAADLATASRRAPFPVAVTAVRSLGRGVAFTLDSEILAGLRGTLRRSWEALLTAQDRQGFRPHITVQNKVSAAEAKGLLQALAAGFAPFEIGATGLSLWRYRGGPCPAEAAFPFTDSPADPPARRHR